MANVQEEIWKDIQGFEGRYQISSIGRVRSLLQGNSHGGGVFIRKKPLLRKPHLNTSGYLHLRLVGDNGKDISAEIHRLVATHFIPNPNNFPEVNHLFGKENNCINSLEWTTRSNNRLHAYSSGLKKARKGEPTRILTADQVVDIFNSPLPQRQLSTKYDVSRTCISSIKTGHHWSKITGKSKNKCTVSPL